MDRYPPREVGIVMSVLLSFGLCCLSVGIGHTPGLVRN
jgi:hypothetical protein